MKRDSIFWILFFSSIPVTKLFIYQDINATSVLLESAFLFAAIFIPVQKIAQENRTNSIRLSKEIREKDTIIQDQKSHTFEIIANNDESIYFSGTNENENEKIKEIIIFFKKSNAKSEIYQLQQDSCLYLIKKNENVICGSIIEGITLNSSKKQISKTTPKLPSQSKEIDFVDWYYEKIDQSPNIVEKNTDIRKIIVSQNTFEEAFNDLKKWATGIPSSLKINNRNQLTITVHNQSIDIHLPIRKINREILLSDEFNRNTTLQEILTKLEEGLHTTPSDHDLLKVVNIKDGNIFTGVTITLSPIYRNFSKGKIGENTSVDA